MNARSHCDRPTKRAATSTKSDPSWPQSLCASPLVDAGVGATLGGGPGTEGGDILAEDFRKTPKLAHRLDPCSGIPAMNPVPAPTR